MLIKNRITARGSLAVMRTGFKADIQCAFTQQVRAFNRPDGIHFGMGTTMLYMVPLANYPAIMDNYTTNHGIGSYPPSSHPGNFNASLHKFIMVRHLLPKK